MIPSKATHRYAKTFFKVSQEKGNLDKVAQDMNFILKIMNSTKGLRSFFRNPIVKKETLKNIFLNKIKDGVDPITVKFFNLLVERNRSHLFAEIPNAFIEYFERHKNILRATIKSVQKLSEEQILKTQKMLKQKTGANDIYIKNIVDPKLIAGIQIKLGDTVIDANIKNKLGQLKRKLAV